MKWWKKAIIASVVWVILITSIAFIHTEIILKGKISPAQDSAISGAYGRTAGSVLILIWILLQVISHRRKK